MGLGRGVAVDMRVIVVSDIHARFGTYGTWESLKSSSTSRKVGTLERGRVAGSQREEEC